MHKADEILEDRAWKRVMSSDLAKKIAVWTVTHTMEDKRKLDMGMKQTVSLRQNNLLWVLRKESTKICCRQGFAL